jgi:hydrogenase expression/formation protein HypC
VHRIVNVALVAGDHGANVSGWVLLHVGLAISRIDEHEAQATPQALRWLGEIYEQELDDLRSSQVS